MGKGIGSPRVETSRLKFLRWKRRKIEHGETIEAERKSRKCIGEGAENSKKKSDDQETCLFGAHYFDVLY